jgi:putative ABC transport system permease protein
MMTRLLARLLGRMPIGWLQLAHNRGRLATAVGGVVFAALLIFMQLGFLGALIESIRLPYAALDADILITASDANTLQDGSPLPRQRMFEALATPGVASATAVFIGRLDWKQPDGTVRTLDVFGIDPSARAFVAPGIDAARDALAMADTALIDRKTRNAAQALFQAIAGGQPYVFEANNRAISVIGVFDIGGGFAADGYLIVSDQTFLRLFPRRAAGAPNMVLVRVAPGADVADVRDRLAGSLTGGDAKARTLAEAVASDQRFQTTQKPIGVVFGFGVVMGALVGIVIVYQVLSTDVADHMREYATLKAIGYRQRFFLGVVFEEAAILAIFGFVPGFLLALAAYALVAMGTGLPLAMTPARAAGVFLATLGMCATSGAIATRRLAGADPAALF